MENYDGTKNRRENAGEHENLRNEDIKTITGEVGDTGSIFRGREGQESEDLNEVNKFMEEMVIEEGSLDDSSFDSTQPQLNFDSTQSYYTLNAIDPVDSLSHENTPRLQIRTHQSNTDSVNLVSTNKNQEKSQPTPTDNQPIQSSSAGSVIKRPYNLVPSQATISSISTDHPGFREDRIHHQGSSHQGHIRFTPEGNEGFIVTSFATNEDPREKNNTPREVDENFLRRYQHNDHLQERFGAGSNERGSVIQRTLAGQHQRSNFDAAPFVQSEFAGINLIRNRIVTEVQKSVLAPIRMNPGQMISGDDESQYYSTDSAASPRSMAGGGGLTDRATSPSAASVTSLQSVSSQASVTGRRYWKGTSHEQEQVILSTFQQRFQKSFVWFLEWDYGSDIGYLDGQPSQVQAAQSLSTLEKLAIGNYSDILRESDGQGQLYDIHSRGRRRNSRVNLGLPPDSMEMDADAKMKMFAESLIRQRELRQHQSRQQQDNTQRVRRKSSSPKRNRVLEGINSEGNTQGQLKDTERAVPVIKRNEISNRKRHDREVVSSPDKIKIGSRMRRSSSLSELPLSYTTGHINSQSESIGPNANIKNLPSNETNTASSNQIKNEVGQKQTICNNTESRGATAVISGPSSSTSSCGTVVPYNNAYDDEDDYAGDSDQHHALSDNDGLLNNLEMGRLASAGASANSLGEVTSDAASLGEQFYRLCRTSRQSSKRSVSTSFETVIAAETGLANSSEKDSFDAEDDNLQLINQVKVNSLGSASQQSAGEWNTRHHNSRFLELHRQHLDQNNQMLLQNQSRQTFNQDERLSQHLQLPPQHIQVSGNSSVPSTSDEEVGRRRVLLDGIARRMDRLRGAETAGDTSTLDSVQMIDRAKSFEYIPGESFPIQENSSSYEYLPGHLVPEQRPPTVLNITPRQQNLSRHGEGAENNNTESLPSVSRPHGNNSDQESRVGEDLASIQEQIHLDQMARNLKGKSRELYAANINMTKHFYKKLRRYLDFLATPSNTVAECRIKQQLAVKISRMLSSEESRLEVSSDQSKVPGLSVSEVEPSSSTSLSSCPNKSASPQQFIKKGPNCGNAHQDSDATTSPNQTGRSNWRTDKTKSEEKYERKTLSKQLEAKDDIDSTNESIIGAESLNKRRAEHLRILKRELKILERLERESKKENVPLSNSNKHVAPLTTTPKNSRKSSHSSAVTTAGKSLATGASLSSPSRKLSYSKRTHAMDDISRLEEGVSGAAGLTRDTTTITDFAFTKDTSTENKNKKDHTLAVETPTLTEHKRLRQQTTDVAVSAAVNTRHTNKIIEGDGELCKTMSSDDLRRHNRRKERRRQMAKTVDQGAQYQQKMYTKTRKLVERGTQMTETDVSSILALSESEIRSSKKVTKKVRHSKYPNQNSSSSRTDTIKVHTRYIQSQSREVSVCAPAPPHVVPSAPSSTEQSPVDFSPPRAGGPNSGAHEYYSPQWQDKEFQHSPVPHEHGQPHNHQHFDPRDRVHFNPTKYGKIENPRGRLDDDTSTITEGDSSASTLCTSSVDTYTQEIRITRTTRHQQWNKENIPQHKSNKSNRHGRTQKSGASPKKNTQPVAYFLPLDNLSPIRLGRKILQDSQPTSGGFHTSGHRDMLAKYIATVDANVDYYHKQRNPHKIVLQSRGVGEVSEDGCQHTKLSLQEALLRKHPHFVHRCQHRVQILKQIRESREERTERYNEWLEQLRDLSPNARKTIRPPSPPPQPRLFSHREMVVATRSKYAALPEVLHQRYETKKEGRYATNRLRAEVYSRQLKRRTKNGQVSLTHHARVF